MTILRARIKLASLVRVVQIGVFDDEDKHKLCNRYKHFLIGDFDGAVLGTVIKDVYEEKVGITVAVEIEPWGEFYVVHEDCQIENVGDLCYKMAELSMMVLAKRKREIF